MAIFVRISGAPATEPSSSHHRNIQHRSLAAPIQPHVTMFLSMPSHSQQTSLLPQVSARWSMSTGSIAALLPNGSWDWLWKIRPEWLQCCLTNLGRNSRFDVFDVTNDRLLSCRRSRSLASHVWRCLEAAMQNLCTSTCARLQKWQNAIQLLEAAATICSNYTLVGVGFAAFTFTVPEM